MDSELLIRVGREALYLLLLVAAPPVLASLVVGLFVSAVQTATQVQEATLSFAPRAAAALLSLAVAGPWIGRQLARFARATLELIATVGL